MRSACDSGPLEPQHAMAVLHHPEEAQQEPDEARLPPHGWGLPFQFKKTCDRVARSSVFYCFRLNSDSTLAFLFGMVVDIGGPLASPPGFVGDGSTTVSFSVRHLHAVAPPYGGNLMEGRRSSKSQRQKSIFGAHRTTRPRRSKGRTADDDDDFDFGTAKASCADDK